MNGRERKKTEEEGAERKEDCYWIWVAAMASHPADRGRGKEKKRRGKKKREGSGCKYICIKELSEKGGKIGKGSVLCCAVCDGHRGGVCDAPVCRRSVPSP